MRHRLSEWVDGWPSVPPLPADPPTATTVVVPCYNHAEHLPFAVQSLLEQSLPTFDVVLVDDASSDGTDTLLHGLAETLRPRGEVRVVRHSRNVGQAATLNEAIGMARTSLVTVLNDDDYLVPSALSAVLDTFRSLPHLALVATGSRWFDGFGRPPREEVPGAHRVITYLPETVRAARRPQDLNMTHSGMTVQRAAWQLVGGYRKNVGSRVVPFSDRDLQLRVGALYPVAVIDAPMVWWRSDSSVDAGVNS